MSRQAVIVTSRDQLDSALVEALAHLELDAVHTPTLADRASPLLPGTLVLVDVRPGLEAVRALKQQCPDHPMVGLCYADTDPDYDALLDAGLDELVPLPAPAGLLTHRLKRVTLHHTASAQLARQRREITTLQAIADCILQTSDAGSSLQRAAEEISQRGDFPVVFIDRYSARQGVLHRQALAGGAHLPETVVQAEGAMHLVESIAGVAVAREAPHHASGNELKAFAREQTLGAAIAMPLLVGGRVTGVITLGHPEALELQTAWMRWATEMASLVSGIQARVRAAEQLQLSEASFQALVAQSPEAILIHRDGRLIDANPKAQRWLAFSDVAEMRQMPIADLIHADDRELVLPLLTQRPGDRQAAPRQHLEEVRLISADGSILTAELAAMDLIFQGELSGVILARDITEATRVRQSLMLSERMAALGRLATGVAHEINNPLSFVIANLGYLEEQLATLGNRLPPDDRAELNEVVGEALEGADRVRRIVQDLQTFSRYEQAPREPVDLLEALESALRMAGTMVHFRARVVRDIETPVPRVLGQATHLEHVFLNLLLNAAQALPEAASEDHEIRLKVRVEEGVRVIVDIIDTGHGIPENLLSRVFEPFFTTRHSGAGPGLGLFTSHSIITGLGGSLSIERSVVGEGTTMRVILPGMTVESPERATQQAPQSALGPETPLKVLVVDDEPSVGKALRRLLREHEVQISESGIAGLEQIKRSQFDLIFWDLMLKDMSGVDAWHYLRELSPGKEAELVFITGGAFTDRAVEFLNSVSNTVLHKPFEPARIKEVLSRGIVKRAGQPRISEAPSPSP